MCSPVTWVPSTAEGEGGVATLPGESAVDIGRDGRMTRALRPVDQEERGAADGGVAPPDLPAWAHEPILMPPAGGAAAPDVLDAGKGGYSRGSPPDLTPPYGGDNGPLAACDTGAWVVAPLDGSFPLYAVSLPESPPCSCATPLREEGELPRACRSLLSLSWCKAVRSYDSGLFVVLFCPVGVDVSLREGLHQRDTMRSVCPCHVSALFLLGALLDAFLPCR